MDGGEDFDGVTCLFNFIESEIVCRERRVRHDLPSAASSWGAWRWLRRTAAHVAEIVEFQRVELAALAGLQEFADDRVILQQAVYCRSPQARYNRKGSA